MKKFISVILCVSLLFSTLALGSGTFAASPSDAIMSGDVESPDATDSQKTMWNIINSALQGILKFICATYPNPPSVRPYDEYDSDEVNFLQGRESFVTEEQENAGWSLGYSRKSIVPDDFEAGKYYMGRKLNIASFDSAAKVQDILDDQLVRAVCVDDGTGEGAVVMAVIDGIGVSSTDVRAIREILSDLTDSGKLASVNVSATHCHSVIDTQGVSGSFLLHLFGSPVSNLLGLDKLPGADVEYAFKDIMISRAAAAIREAYESMEKGNFYYKTIDGTQYIHDKKAPISYCTDIASLRFEPDSDNDGTYIIDMAAHPTSFSYRNESLSSDYLYYMEEEFNKADYNMLFLQGAVGQIGRETSTVTADTSYTDERQATTSGYGKAVASLILNDSKKEERLDAILNAKHEEFNVKCTNYLLMLAVKCRLVNNTAYKTGFGVDNFVLPTEIGYVELGGRVGLALYPAELYPEVYWGGAFTAEDSWDGTDWEYSENSMSKMNRDGVDMYPVCFANDTVGYVVPDNDFAFLAHEPDELLSAGKNTASTIVKAFIKLMDDID